MSPSAATAGSTPTAQNAEPVTTERIVSSLVDNSINRTSTDTVSYNTNRTLYKNPDESMGINFGDDTKLLWISMESIEIKEQRNIIRPDTTGGVVANASAKKYTFEFLSSQELTETLAHEWAPYENISSTIQQLFGTTLIMGLGTAKALMNTSPEMKAALSGIAAGANIMDTVGGLTKNLLANEEIKNWRVDLPLVYKNTERRTYEFAFNLVSLKGDPLNEVVEPVKMLQALSCPEKSPDAEGGYNPIVIPPYVFKVTSKPSVSKNPLISIPYAALRQVNPVWKGPYVNGQPMRCELRLSFQEIAPVFAGSIFSDGRVKVTVRNVAGGTNQVSQAEEDFVNSRGRTIAQQTGGV
jgi:hypothetical protein